MKLNRILILVSYFSFLTSVHSKNIEAPEVNVLKILFGQNADTELKVYDKSSRPDVTNSYFLTRFKSDDKKKEYPSVSTVGNDNYFSICPAYLDIIKEIVLEEKSLEITFYNELENHKIVRQFFHNAYTTIRYGSTGDQSKFRESKTVATKAAQINLATLYKGRLENHLGVFQKCKDRRPTFYPPSEDKHYSATLNEVEEKLKQMITSSNAAGQGRGTISPNGSGK